MWRHPGLINVECFSSSSVSVESGGSSASVHVPLWRSVGSDSPEPAAGPQLPAGLLHHAGLRAPGPPGAAPWLPLHQPAVTGERQHQETSSGRETDEGKQRVLTVTSSTSRFSSRILAFSYERRSGPVFCEYQQHVWTRITVQSRVSLRFWSHTASCLSSAGSRPWRHVRSAPLCGSRPAARHAALRLASAGQRLQPPAGGATTLLHRTTTRWNVCEQNTELIETSDWWFLFTDRCDSVFQLFRFRLTRPSSCPSTRLLTDPSSSSQLDPERGRPAFLCDITTFPPPDFTTRRPSDGNIVRGTFLILNVNTGEAGLKTRTGGNFWTDDSGNSLFLPVHLHPSFYRPNQFINNKTTENNQSVWLHLKSSTCSQFPTWNHFFFLKRFFSPGFTQKNSHTKNLLERFFLARFQTCTKKSPDSKFFSKI